MMIHWTDGEGLTHSTFIDERKIVTCDVFKNPSKKGSEITLSIGFGGEPDEDFVMHFPMSFEKYVRDKFVVIQSQGFNKNQDLDVVALKPTRQNAAKSRSDYHDDYESAY